jgi:hypothetical protein
MERKEEGRGGGVVSEKDVISGVSLFFLLIPLCYRMHTQVHTYRG